MFYLLFCGLILSIEVVCFILYMLPLVTIELTPYSELLGSYTEESYTMIDYLGESYGIFSFSFTILSRLKCLLSHMHQLQSKYISNLDWSKANIQIIKF